MYQFEIGERVTDTQDSPFSFTGIIIHRETIKDSDKSELALYTVEIMTINGIPHNSSLFIVNGKLRTRLLDSELCLLGKH